MATSDLSEMKKNLSKPISYDPMIIPRVKQYLEENVHQTYVDVGLMARLLQGRYREYSRRKSVPFRQLVEQAYKTVLHSYGLDSNPSSEENDDVSSDLEMMEDRPSGNHMNNLLTNLYVDNKGSAGNQNNELIDISSDDTDNEDENTDVVEKKNKKRSNDYKSVDSQMNQITITKKVMPPAEQIQPPVSVITAKPLAITMSKLNKVPPVVVVPTTVAMPNSGHPTKKRKVMTIEQNNKSSVSPNNKNVPNASNKGPPKIGGIRRESQSESNTPNVVMPKTPKKFKREIAVQRSPLKFENIGGMDRVLKELCDLLMHIKHPEVYRHIGLPPPRGFLLHGPPGCGKTLLAQAIAGQLGVCMIQVAATELVAGVSGESEERIRDLFEQAYTVAPCVLFIDEIDAISSNRVHAQKDMERRIVAQLLSSFDGLSKYVEGDQVLVIGATNRPDALDPALRRVGRFDQEISLGIPDRPARESILRVICSKLTLDRPFDYDAVAALTPGYVGADLLALASRAASIAIKRVFHAKEEEIVRSRSFRPTYISHKIPTVNLTEDSILAHTDQITQKQANAMIDLIDDALMSDLDAALKEDGIETNVVPQPTTNESVEPVNGLDASSHVLTTTATTTVDGDVEAVPKPEETIETTAAANNGIDDEEVVENKQIEAAIADKPSDESAMVAVIEEQSAEPPTENHEDNKNVEDGTSEKEIATTDVDEAMDVSEEKPVETVEIVVDKSMEVVDLDDLPDEETLGEAMLRNDAVKLNLGLEEMLRWLSDEQPPIDADDLDKLSITMNDFRDAVKLVQPSAKREGFITVPDVTWDDIGSLRDIREALQLAVLAPVKFPGKLLALGLQSPSGVLLCGPPGCGKTLLAKAVANEAGINFISVKGPELLNMYVGESERAVRLCFQRARNSAPCVIFFDEFDSLCPARSGSSENNGSSRVVNQLLTEMDGIEDRKGVFLMAATNRPDIVDPAVLRPGRLDKILYVGMPELNDRAEILKALTKKKPTLGDDVDFQELATLTDGYTGADLGGLLRQASLLALKESIAATPDFVIGKDADDMTIAVNRNHFLTALRDIRPSVSAEFTAA